MVLKVLESSSKYSYRNDHSNKLRDTEKQASGHESQGLRKITEDFKKDKVLQELKLPGKYRNIKNNINKNPTGYKYRNF